MKHELNVTLKQGIVPQITKIKLKFGNRMIAFEI